MKSMGIEKVVFVSLVKNLENNALALVLAESIRSFAGRMSNAPIWLFTPRPQDAPKAMKELDVSIVSLVESDEIPPYLFGPMVYSCAKAEEMARGRFDSLVWIDASCLVVAPPELYDLGEDADAAVRPVHIRNVGSPAAENPDGYWQGIFDAVGVEDVTSTVTSFVDARLLRSYFNTHSFAVNPDKGLMNRWLELFKGLVADKKFQEAYCQDELHRIFLFQALLSTLLASTVRPERLRVLPSDYNYPYNLHQQVPAERRAKALNDLVCLTYEGRSLHPEKADDIEIREPLKTWLADRVVT